MRAFLGSNAFSSIRSLMLRQQSTYAQQLFELHNLSQVQGQLMHEMQLQGSGEGHGAFTHPLQQCQYQPWYSPFSLEAAYCRESGCGAPQPSSSPQPQARLAHLRHIVRSLGNLPKAMRGGVRDDLNASTVCPPLPPPPCNLLRPLAESMLLPPDEQLGGGSALSQQQPTVQQMEQNSFVLPGRRDGGRVSEESAVGAEKREEETRGGEGTSRLWRPGDDVDDESWPPGVSVALDKVSWSTWPFLRAKSTAVSHFLPCLKLIYYDSADIATQLAQPWMPPALSSAATATVCQLMPPGSSHISMPQVGVSVSGRGLRGAPLLIERSEKGRGCIV